MRASLEPPTRTAPPRTLERPVGDLFRDLATETSLLVHQEVTLATVELTQKAEYAGRQVAYLMVGFLLGVVSLLALLGALILILATEIQLWESALYVGLIAAFIAIGFAGKAMVSLRSMRLAPSQTIETLKEDKQWIKEQLE